MATAAQLTDNDFAKRETERQNRNLAEAFIVREAANALFNALSKADGHYSTAAMHRQLDLCNAIIGMMIDGDASAQRDSLMWELRCDEYGNAVRDDDAVEAPWCDADKQRVFGGYR